MLIKVKQKKIVAYFYYFLGGCGIITCKRQSMLAMSKKISCTAKTAEKIIVQGEKGSHVKKTKKKTEKKKKKRTRTFYSSPMIKVIKSLS